MDNKQIEQELDELEGRLERLRALYEQYFLGLEKLEPTVLRKDIDRKMWVMRREQIRNTGLRFKFQMLIQRYNTYQQYWTRIVREIENGTYRRDILKVAQRFGEKDALTILGKKRAEQYKRLAKNQLERRRRRKGEPEEEPKPAEQAAPKPDEEIALGADDYELVEEERDDEVTPRKDLPPVTGARDHGEPDMESLLMFATVGVKDWSAPRSAPIQADPPTPETPKIEASRADPPKAEAPKSDAPRADPPKAEAPKPEAKAVATSAAKSRVAELAAQMRAKKEAAKAKVDELDLDHLLDPAPGADLAPPRVPSPPKAAAPEAPKPPPTPLPVRPVFKPSAASTTPIPKPPPSLGAKATPVPQPAPSQPGPSSPFPRPASTISLPSAPSPSTPKPAPSPAAPKPAPSAAPAKPPAKDDLSEQKMREIYAKYVGAKRAANESTAGITFDKLAQSLRAQAEKIRTSHPTRTIDFEVVTKDGKTALRPIVK